MGSSAEFGLEGRPKSVLVDVVDFADIVEGAGEELDIDIALDATRRLSGLS